MIALGKSGAYCAIALSAVGSSIGTGIAGTSALGAWKKCYVYGRPPPFQLAVFTSAPMSQTIYGMILMTLIVNKIQDGAAAYWPVFLAIGIAGGIAMGTSAWFQGVAGAGACDSFAETNKGFTNNLMILGIVETVALFAMVFGIVLLNSIKT
ncbi:MAG: V-type ATP synthase subunit K [Lentisphaerae bacterium GWF2_50_93]|nr:MAG: V-type ATP synthase subunit K [Lentisphaerae bacterium GWF2_50_93]